MGCAIILAVSVAGQIFGLTGFKHESASSVCFKIHYCSTCALTSTYDDEYDNFYGAITQHYKAITRAP